MDDLERLIGEHRSALDTVESPNADRGWASLQTQLGKRRAETRVRRLRWSLGAVASLLLLVAASWWWTATKPGSGGLENSPLVSDYAPELYAEERRYLASIEEKQAGLDLERVDTTLFAPFLEELRLIDSLQRSDLEGLPQVGVNDRSLRALIRYYHIKLQLLERLEDELHEQQKRRQRQDQSI
ncbi:hypothetical protein [Lewinella sp. IMCC34183]|uniref:hypothetical protein n=1 Tax=Lewinella sp. IMCC34183 TaxID=2248762 RepID=UPI000E2696EC|nr:hypothetical protein [Lewinella sp. IMCC34183]